MKFLDYIAHGTEGVTTAGGRPDDLVFDLDLFKAWLRTSKADVGDAAWGTLAGLLSALEKHAGGTTERVAVIPWAERATLADTNALLRQIADSRRAPTWRKGTPLLAESFDDQVVRARFIALAAVCGALDTSASNPFPFIVFHNVASSHVAGYGFTLKFQTDHMSQNSDSERRAGKVADRRFAPARPGRPGISRSTTIDQKDEKRFFDEVKSRKQEFSDTYKALSDWYVRRLTGKPRFGVTRGGVPRRPLIDGVTFVSRESFTLHEYERVGTGKQGTERSDRVHFSLAPTPDGKDWAVHHLNGSGLELGADYVRLVDMGLTQAGIDGLSYCQPAFPD